MILKHDYLDLIGRRNVFSGLTNKSWKIFCAVFLHGNDSKVRKYAVNPTLTSTQEFKSTNGFIYLFFSADLLQGKFISPA